MNRRKKIEERRKARNPFTKWVTGSITAVLIGSAAFTMLMFGNGSIFRVSQDQKNSAREIRMPVTYSQEKITPPKKDNETNLGNISTSDPGASGGGGNGTNPDPGIPGVSGGVNQFTSGSIPDQVHITDEDIAADIAAGLYTQEDYDYLVGLSGESGSYRGFYTVACCVRNRAVKGNQSIRAAATAPGQFAGFKQSNIGNPANQDIKDAAVAMLRGGPSNIGTATYFFGRVNGYTMWAEPDCLEFYNVGNNVFYNTWGEVHNKTSSVKPDAIIIYDHTTSTWIYPDGSGYHQ